MAGEEICSPSAGEDIPSDIPQSKSDGVDGDILSDIHDESIVDILNEEIMVLFREELERIPELLKYINKLRSFIRKQHERIKTLLGKANDENKDEVAQMKDAFVQTDFELDNLEKLDQEWQAKRESDKSDEVWRERETASSVAEQVKEAAESALKQTGFVYEESSGMYYDYNTGYYYNAELGLYYDGNNGVYYYYDERNNSFQFHSQIEQKSVEVEVEVAPKRKLKKVKSKSDHERRKRKAEDSLEEGECSDSTEESDVSSDAEDSSDEALTEQAMAWPPCMRIIVKEANTSHLKVGTLFIVPYTGGTVGREGDHVFCLPDINVSKSHIKLLFDETEGKYFVEDLGSRNGTILNGQRLEEGVDGKQEVVHGSVLQMGNIKLLCHIHVGRDATCGHCEPGLIQQTSSPTIETDNLQTSSSKGEQHRKELKRLRKKFGLQSSDNDSTPVVAGYEDRAQLRRKTVGSQNPYEKTETASIEEPIPSQNKGFQLLERMGWSQGQSLGKDGDGCTEPESNFDMLWEEPLTTTNVFHSLFLIFVYVNTVNQIDSYDCLISYVVFCASFWLKLKIEHTTICDNCSSIQNVLSRSRISTSEIPEFFHSHLVFKDES
ncbi:Angiogenic factor with G patch and FHA domains 1 [Gryllus bimaculatus]|nr:Angiogenic factor with G patch and FHA domains 1 [Gryllus bimaculatus]